MTTPTKKFPPSYSIRRTSIYGTDDRIIFDIGSSFIKAGFSGEPTPRVFLKTPSPNLNDDWLSLNWEQTHLPLTEEILTHMLRNIFFTHLLADPKQRKVIVCETPLMPLVLKNLIAKVLFERLQVPSVSFAPSPMLALLTTGLTSGLVIDCGNLETSVLPIFDARPLYPFVTSTPRAGLVLTRRLSQLLSAHALSIPTSFSTMSISTASTPGPTQNGELSRNTLEDIKTRLLFVSIDKFFPPSTTPILDFTALQFQSSAQEDQCMQLLKERWATASPASDIQYTVRTLQGNRSSIISIPGWIRERTAEVLFEGDEDAMSIADCVLECLLKVGPDMRSVFASSMLLTGGTSHLPQFQKRLLLELQQSVQEKKRYRSLKGLVSKFSFLDDEDKNTETGGRRGAAFMPNVRSWVGGSLIGAVRSGGPEITREAYVTANGSSSIIPDWTVRNEPIARAAA